MPGVPCSLAFIFWLVTVSVVPEVGWFGSLWVTEAAAHESKLEQAIAVVKQGVTPCNTVNKSASAQLLYRSIG